jgi:peptidyl-dipeptidase Dcp
MSENPLLTVSGLPNKAPPFDKIGEEHYMPAVESAIAGARDNIARIRENAEAPDFKNTIAALETSDETLGYVMSVFYNQLTANGTDKMHELAEEIGPAGAAFSSEVLQDEALFARIKEVNDKKDRLSLTPEQETLLDNTYKSFVRGGALLDENGKARLREIDSRLAVLSPAFMNNTKKAIEAFELVIEDEKDLSGLPENTVEAAKITAEEKGYEGKWVLTLDMPVYMPVMQYADNRDIREKMWRAFSSRAWKDKFDNSGNAREIACLRHERANLLGYDSHAHFVLERRMAETPQNVWDFLDTFKDAYYPKAREDLDNIRKFAGGNGGPADIKPWDVGYYAEKLKQHLYEFSSEDLRPYFPLNDVLSGIFEHFSRLFNVSFRKSDQYPVWHDDVVTYDVYDLSDGSFLGTLYGDFYPRKGKKDGEWKTSYRDQGLYFGEIERPVVAICCNFPKPTASNPSLLSHNEINTLFHEMGHAMHGLLSKVTYQSLAGTNVLWDFVELPSQVQENWTYKKETLDIFARHYKTGAEIPEELVSKLNKAKNFMVGWTGLRQTALGILDMSWHDRDPSGIEDIGEYEDEILKDVTLLPRLAGPVSTAFSHIFAGGYSSGYYSYKWAEVLDADTFELFEEKGLYDLESAGKYREEILEKGGSRHPRILYRNFRGRDADSQALIRREGLLKA